MPLSKEAKAKANREYRARKALAAGREPGKTGRPKLIGPPKPKHLNRDRTGDYRRQRDRRREQAMYRDATNGEPIDPMTVPIYAQAVEVANSLTKQDQRTSVAEDLWDDLVCEAALAICEGSDPYEMAKAFKSRYYTIKNKWITGVADGQFSAIEELPTYGDFGQSVYQVRRTS